MAETIEIKSSDIDMLTSDEVINRSDVQNPNSSSDLDSDSDDEDEARENLQLQTLESELSNNPSNYDAHVQYIKLLRRLGQIEKLREAREAMSALFPLSPQMWQEWAKDEASLSTGSEAFPMIEKLYERGVFDYMSVSLWCEYLNFVQEYDPSVRDHSDPGILKARNLFERALTAVGLHVAEGSKIWGAYREFEQAIFHTIDVANIEAKEKQVQRIRSIFHRQLSVPLVDLRSTLLAYKAWEVERDTVLDVNSSDLDGISSHVALAYQKASEIYNVRVHHEEQISRHDIPDSERLQQFMSYLKLEQFYGDPARVQILYERAITEFPISNDLWLDYTRYLDRTLKIANVTRDVYSRATKNCPWVGELWVGYLLSLERGHVSEKEICAIFEKALQCTFSSFEEYLDLFLTRIDSLRRRISQNHEAGNVLDYSLIRDTFQHASSYLSPHLKNTDGLLRLHAYWARLELNLAKDLVAVREVWESALKICGSMLEAWLGFITMEVEMGHINEARSIYKRCYSKRFIGTGSEEICNSWLRFEREFGTLEDFDRAVQKVTPRLEELQLFKVQQESNAVAGTTDQKQNLNNKSSREKRKPDSKVTDEQPSAKRQKNTAQNLQKAHGKDKAQAQKSVESNKVEETKAKVEIHESTNEQEIKDSMPKKTKPYTDQCTAFISNLSLQAEAQQLRDFFSDVGGVVAIRILKDKFTGKSRGLAYVDFSDDAHLAAALAKNRKMLLGKKLSIARSDPKQRKKKESTEQSIAVQHGEGVDHSSDQTNSIGSDSCESGGVSKESRTAQAPSSTNRHGDDNIQLKGKNTFAIPRNVRPLGVRPLGWTKNKPEPEEGGDEKPKSNDEFRKMFING